MNARLVVTLPPGQDALLYARRCRDAGAQLLELRNDLVTPWNQGVDPAALAAVIPYLLARRARGDVPSSYVQHAALLDEPLGEPSSAATLWSFHAHMPMATSDVLSMWERAGPAAHVQLKHVEPLGDVAQANRLLETARVLRQRFGAHRVTVLATGQLALPWRAVLGEHNALDYVAVDGSFLAAPGQRLLRDAVRCRRGNGPRKAIVGTQIGHARSPMLHPQPFDRWDLPDQAPVVSIMDALRPHYCGFAVTSPFKKTVARDLGSPLDAVNTVVRAAQGWNAFNTDVDGAHAALRGEADGPITVLGDGGVTAALRLAQPDRPWRLLTRANAAGARVTGTVVWTWPANVEPPQGLVMTGARVLVVAYGPPAWRVARMVRDRGGEPVMRGHRWLIAQARAQRRLWEAAA